MKKHAIIPIFIPHRGCPNDCVFCNQRMITTHSDGVSAEDVKNTIEQWLSTLENMNLEMVEVAFFGGSFTGIPMEEQRAFLSAALPYKVSGRIDKIHLSTRPDYISNEILDNLKEYGVDVIELGVQSFDDKVLKASGRGCSSSDAYRASQLIKEYGFTLGIQLMVGLPCSTFESDVNSAVETVKIGPKLARLYPTVVIPGTQLDKMAKAGIYKPMNGDEAIERTAAMYRVLDDAGINIIRVGLKSNDLISGETFHPAFRQLVEGKIAREDLEHQLLELYPDIKDPHRSGLCPLVWFVSNEKSRNNMFGHKASNRDFFAREYPGVNIEYKLDSESGLSLPDNRYLVIDRGTAMDFLSENIRKHNHNTEGEK